MAKQFKPRMSDDAVNAKTGRDWSEWFKLLDKAGGKKMNHQQIVAVVSGNGAGPWWQQMVAVTYEQACGLREKHQKPGGFEISVSRTIATPISKAFKAWTDEETLKQWLPANFTVRKSTPNKTVRITWNDGTDVAAAFLPKGVSKCQVVAQHGKLKDAKAGAKMKKFWSDALDRLKKTIE